MIIDGKVMAGVVLARTKARAEALGRRPNILAYVAPDQTPATSSYLKIKARSAEAAGCDFEETASLTLSSRADALLVQLPLPPDVDASEVLNAIPPTQDADVLSSAAREKFEKGDTDALLPPVVGAVAEILEQNHIEVAGKKAVVIGSGFLVGAPVAVWLTQQGAEVSVLNRESGDLHGSLLHAEIIVCGAGTPYLVRPEMLTPGVILIDAGTSESNGEMVGDADPLCSEKCALFTPVPGGVGPIAVAKLFENVVTLAERAINH